MKTEYNRPQTILYVVKISRLLQNGSLTGDGMIVDDTVDPNQADARESGWTHSSNLWED